MAAVAWISACLCLCVAVGHVLGAGVPTNYNVGIGIADITGPAAEVNMMGYANPAQTAAGIHLRQFSRTFIIADADMKNKVVFVNIDGCMVSVAVKQQVLKRLKEKFGNEYTERNLCISGTHTHSGPAGFHQYLLFDITSLGFVKETFDSLVEGISISIERAHSNMKAANLYMNSGELLESNINRSPSAYLHNPAEERAKYQYDVDKTMTVIKIVDSNDVPIGMINWFAVHCTSMNNTNHLISSDNKGYAAVLFERLMNDGAFPGKGSFVAAFGQSNEGDVSPNTKGPHCLDTGLPCDTNTSTCNGRNEMCVAFGPGNDMFESTKIIAENQFKKAKELFDSAKTLISGPVDFRQTYVDMTNVEVTKPDGAKVKTCQPAMGYSFAAGTTDGPGAFDFTQGQTKDNPFWNAISGFLSKPTQEQIDCQKPKPILLNTGGIGRPYAWQPSILDMQILRVGQLVLAAVPTEMTTMSGRRMRDAVATAATQAGMKDTPVPIIVGLANDYADYVATPEEYQAQRYEGGSTTYGPNTLNAYLQIYRNLSTALIKDEPVAQGPTPPDLLPDQLSFLPGVIFDSAGFTHQFGDVVKQPQASYKPGETVVVEFVGANPRNDRKFESTFLEVQFQERDGTWTVQYTDSHWETRFAWKSVSLLLGESQITITWDIPSDQKPGQYRIVYHGNHKSIGGSVTAFTGVSQSFRVDTSSSKHQRQQKQQQKLRKWNLLQKMGQSKNGLN